MMHIHNVFFITVCVTHRESSSRALAVQGRWSWTGLVACSLLQRGDGWGL